MKAPVLALKQPGNHGPHAGSICKKICPQRPQPGKYDYFAQPESYSRSGAWEFFTEDEPGAGGPVLARRAQSVDQRDRQVPAGAVAADRDRAGREALRTQKAPGGERVLMRGREGMLGRKAVADRERAPARRASDLRHHTAVAQDRARAKAASVEEQQHARGVGAGRDRPLPRHAAAIDRLAADVVGDGPDPHD